MGYQGQFPPETLPLLMLPWDLFTIGKMEFYGKVNFLKGALVFSDFITTVSRKYSQEIQTAEYGFGLEGVLRSRAATVTGILNGVDYNVWSPQTDTFIKQQLFARRPQRQAGLQAGPAGGFRRHHAQPAAARHRHRVALRGAERL